MSATKGKCCWTIHSCHTHWGIIKTTFVCVHPGLSGYYSRTNVHVPGWNVHNKSRFQTQRHPSAGTGPWLRKGKLIRLYCAAAYPYLREQTSGFMPLGERIRSPSATVVLWCRLGSALWSTLVLMCETAAGAGSSGHAIQWTWQWFCWLVWFRYASLSDLVHRQKAENCV